MRYSINACFPIQDWRLFDYFAICVVRFAAFEPLHTFIILKAGATTHINHRRITLISSSVKLAEPAPIRPHEYWMERAIAEAGKAKARNEVPIGCVIVREGRVIARGHNLRESSQDPTGHAELIAIRKAAHGIYGVKSMGSGLETNLWGQVLKYKFLLL